MDGEQKERRRLKNVTAGEDNGKPAVPYTVFIRPTLADPIEVAESVMHELIHSVLPGVKGHPQRFQEVSRKLGLVMTHKNGHTEIDAGKHVWYNHPRRGAGTKPNDGSPGTHQGRELLKLLTKITTDLGAYPHVALPEHPISAGASPGEKKWTKFRCPECKWVVRIGPSSLTMGAPICGNLECENYGEECEER